MNIARRQLLAAAGLAGDRYRRHAARQTGDLSAQFGVALVDGDFLKHIV